MPDIPFLSRFAALLSLVVLLAYSPAANAQEKGAEGIAAGYVDSIGGAEAWRAVRSLRMQGTTVVEGLEFPLSITTAAGGKQRIEVGIRDSPMIQAYDGRVAWMTFPMQGITEPRLLEGEELAAVRDHPFLNVFIDYARRGYRLQTVADTVLENVPVYGIHVTHASGYDQTHYFGKKSLLPVCQIAKSRGATGRTTVVETYFDDYRRFDGLLLPTSLRQRVAGRESMRMTITDVELNPALPPDHFSPSPEHR
ncbi:hypothetical protein [Lewinella sp. JB7]|uniref:hypothetical protein n=1 Tax=Lewinella sp. JB7 TaxID=2962887 RepID=UPI0020CA0151|nr:hypothetical protein [Lewinella sp. JB7]MCP9235876.1 hypothetical protein [Lewinella sp. JB7]